MTSWRSRRPSAVPLARPMTSCLMSVFSACSLAVSRVAPIPFVRSCGATQARKCWCCPRSPTPRRCPQFMRSGVAGLTHQDQSVAQIAESLDAIEAGRSVLDPGPLRFPARDRNRLCELSPREKEILTRIAGGQSTRQMSSAMNITVDTVRTYVKNVLTKLGAHSRLQLAALASQDGLLIDQATALDVFPPVDKRGSASDRGPLPEERARARRR